jgi:hypothetical protein
MRKVFPHLVLCFALLASIRTSAQPRISIAQIVNQGVPSDINITPQVAGSDSCSLLFSAFPDGTPQLVAAAYTNGVFGHVRMLSVDSQTLQVSVIADVDPSQYLLAGAGCQVALVDLSGTSGNGALSNVLQIDFPGLSGQGTASWFFRWDGTKFINLGPTTPVLGASPDTLLYLASPMDLDHNGVLQIVSLGDGDLHPDEDTGIWNLPTHLVWSFNGTSFVQERNLVELATFSRSEGAPAPVLTNIIPDTCDQPECSEFELANPASSYILKIINGDADGGNRASSGHVLLNNIEIVSPSDLSQKVEFIAKPVTLLRKNTLYATLEGKPGSTISVTIEPQTGP